MVPSLAALVVGRGDGTDGEAELEIVCIWFETLKKSPVMCLLCPCAAKRLKAAANMTSHLLVRGNIKAERG